MIDEESDSGSGDTDQQRNKRRNVWQFCINAVNYCVALCSNVKVLIAMELVSLAKKVAPLTMMVVIEEEVGMCSGMNQGKFSIFSLFCRVRIFRSVESLTK